MKNKFALTYILFIVCMTMPLESYGLVYIDINAPVLNKFPMAIARILNLSEKDEELERKMAKASQTLHDDLKSAGIFDVLDPIMYLEDVERAGITISAIDFDDWTIIGAEGLVKIGYRLQENDMIEVQMRLFDTYQQQMILGKKYIGTKNDANRMMHRFANEILEKFTGERGIFGSKITYVQDVKSYKELFVMDFDGSSNIQITRDFSINLSPAWSPDGMKIVYTSYKHGNPDLMVKDFVRQESSRISKRKGLNLGAEWSPDGKKFALMMSKGNNSEIYIIDAESGKELDRLTQYWGIDVSPTWSPDGKRIAFTSDRSGNPNIYILDVDTKEAKRITFDGKYNSSPAWSPLGDRIVFCGQTKDNLFNVFTINPDGTGLSQLTEKSGNNENPSWSPDGRQIVFASNREGNYDIYVMNANGTSIKRLTFSEGDATSPAWSPRLE